MVGVAQEVQDIADAFAQELGLVIVVFGTWVNSFGDLLLEAIWPLTG